MSVEKPFIGLRPFESSDEPYFFGRRTQTSELLKRLNEQRFLAVIGGSGSGKSSLIKAGLIPVIERGFLVEQRSAWLHLTMRPGVRPLEVLADQLKKLREAPGASRAYLAETAPKPIVPPSDGDELPRLAQLPGRQACQVITNYLATHSFPLDVGAENGVNQHPAKPASLLLFVDQFEEVFRYTLSRSDQSLAKQARTFVDVLLKLSKQRDVQVFVVTTMRADFMGACEEFPDLNAAMNTGLYLVPRLTLSQLSDAIERPMLATNGRISPRLRDLLLEECSDQLHGSRGEVIDQLPLLQHALMRTWQEWRHDESAEAVTVEHYKRAGTMASALRDHLEKDVWAILSPADRELTERLFKALTDTDLANRQVRRPTRLSDLIVLTGASRERILDVLGQFSGPERAFVTWESESDDPMVDICHESLIRKWDRLKEWVVEEANLSVAYGQLLEAAAMRARAPKFIWNDPLRQPPFASALQFWQHDPPDKAWATRLPLPREAEKLGWNVEQAYSSAMEFWRVSRKAYVLKQMKRWALAGAVAASVLAAGVGLWLWGQHSTNVAKSNHLAIESGELASNQPLTSVRLALEAVKANSSTQALGALQQATGYAAGQTYGLSISSSISPDGHWLFTLLNKDAAGTLALARWDVRNPTAAMDRLPDLSIAPIARPSQWLPSIASGRDRLAIQTAVDRISVVDASNWKIFTELEPKHLWGGNRRKLPDGDPTISTVHMSSSDDWLFVGTRGGSVHACELTNPSQAACHTLHGHKRAVGFIKVSPDNKWAVTNDDDGVTFLWSVEDLRRSVDVVPEGKNAVTGGSVSSAAFTPDSHCIVYGNESGKAWIQSVGASACDLQGPVVSDGQLPIVAMAIAARKPDMWLITGDVQGTIRAWPLVRDASGKRVDAPILLSSGVKNAGVKILKTSPEPEGHWLAAVQTRGPVALWDLRQLGSELFEQRPILLRGEMTTSELTFSRDGRWLSTTETLSKDEGHAARLWNLAVADPGATTVVHRNHDTDADNVQISDDGSWEVVVRRNGEVVACDLFDDEVNAVRVEHHKHDVTKAVVVVAAAVDDQERSHPVGTRVSLNANVVVQYGSEPNLGIKARAWRIVKSEQPQADRARIVSVPLDMSAAQDDHIVAVGFTPNGDTMITGAVEKGQSTVRLWTVGKEQLTPKSEKSNAAAGRVQSVAVSPDGTVAVAIDRSGTVRLFKVNGSKLVASELNTPPSIRRPTSASVVTFSADGRWLFIGQDLVDQAYLWNVASGQLFSQVTTTVRAAAFLNRQHGEPSLIIAGQDGLTTRLDLDAPSNPPRHQSVHNGAVSTVAVAANGMYFMTGGDNGLIHLWDVSSGELEPIMFRDGGPISSSVFLKDRLITATSDGSAREWYLDRATLLAHAHQVAGNGMTPTEWTEFYNGPEWSFSALLTAIQRRVYQ